MRPRCNASVERGDTKPVEISIMQNARRTRCRASYENVLNPADSRETKWHPDSKPEILAYYRNF